MERICFSSNIGIFDPPPCPIMLAHAFFNFSILINLYLFFIISGLDYKVSPKKVCLGFLSTKIHCFVVKSTSRGTKPIDGGGGVVNETFLSKMPC